MLTICITVYNQIEILRKNLISMLKYEGHDIEFLISDDCSTDDVEGLVNDLNDSRIRYCKTVSNSGHDKNILNALRCASGEYALVLRSRDYIRYESIGCIMEVLDKCEDAVYIVFSAVDEDGNEKILLSDKRYTVGRDAINAHAKLFVHPSGNIYRISALDLNALEEAVDLSFSHKFGFTVHELARMELACKGDFITSSLKAWVYVNTEKQSDVAVNSKPDKTSVYSPKLNYERCRCELLFVNSILDTNEEYRLLLNRHIIWVFNKRITRDFVTINCDVRLQYHYGFEEVDFSSIQERIRYCRFISALLSELQVESREYLLFWLWIDSVRLTAWFPIRDMVAGRIIANSHIVKCLKGL